MAAAQPPMNKYRAALEVLQRGRDRLVTELADQVLDQADDLLESGFLFNEFLENQGTKLHFLSLLAAQLEQSAESHEERQALSDPALDGGLPPLYDPDDLPIPTEATVPTEPPRRRRKPRAKKLTEQASREGEPGET
jgi:hypothetical protein